MRLQHVVIVLAAFGLSSCRLGVKSKKSSDTSRDTLSYEYKTFKERHPNCKENADSNCVFVKFKYPVFKGQGALNDSITYRLVTLFSFVHRANTSIQQVSKNFFSMYTNSPSNFHNKIVYPSINEYAKVLRQDSSITTIEIYGHFNQTDHPLSYTYFINWDTKSSKNLTLDDLLINGYSDKLNKIGETIFKKDEKLTDTTSLKNYRFKEHTGKEFMLNSNYLITPKGLSFLYNEAEIKQYTAGPTNLFIPFTQIKSLLRPNTVVTQYVK